MVRSDSAWAAVQSRASFLWGYAEPVAGALRKPRHVTASCALPAEMLRLGGCTRKGVPCRAARLSACLFGVQLCYMLHPWS